MIAQTDRFVTILLCLGLFFAYLLVASHFLPSGVNAAFAQQAWKRLLVLMGVVYCIWAVAHFLTKNSAFHYLNRRERFEPRDLLLLLLPMTPVVQYILLNRDILGLVDAAATLALFLLVAATLSFLVPFLLGAVGPATLFMLIGLSLSYFLFNMASLTHSLRWHQVGDIRLQLPILLMIFVILVLLYKGAKLALHFTVCALFVLTTASTALSSTSLRDAIRSGPSASPLYDLVKGRDLKRSPDIFLLVYESYAPTETLLHYGIDNQSQDELLERHGFRIYRSAYTTGMNTITSMSRVFEVNNQVKGNIRLPAAGGGAVQSIFRRMGYETIGIFPFDYFFRGVGSYYDETFPAESLAQTSNHTLLIRSITEGEFRFDAGFDQVPYSDYLSRKRTELATSRSAPRLVYSHNLYPGHSQNSGRCLANEVDLYRERLQLANQEMRRDLEVISAASPQAIVIVASDHGPYLTKDCYQLRGWPTEEVDRVDVQDRHGVLLAIRWPTDAEVEDGKIGVLQDVFPAVLSYLYGEPSILDARVEPIVNGSVTGGVMVHGGVLQGGVHDGEPLFEGFP